MARMKARRLALVVAREGALPVPVAPEPQALSEADELAAFRALELGDLDGRRSACCGKPNHMTWLRKIDDTRACPWCVMELQNDSLVARTHQLASYQEVERNFWANQRADESLAAVANRRIAELNQERDQLKARLEALTPAAIQTCRKCGAGYAYGEPCSSCLFRARMAAELKARGLDGEHYPLVHHSYRVSHDLPETGGSDPGERLLDGDDLKRAVRGHLFGGGGS